MLRYWPILLWLLYFVFPYDLVPDFLPGIGWIEDLLLLGLLYWFFFKKKQRIPEQEPTGRDERNYQWNSAGDSHNSHFSYRKERNNAKDPYQILGVRRSATFAEIKRAYRLQANRYHPDKVAHLGEEFQALAKEKFQEIQWAYDRLKTSKGP